MKKVITTIIMIISIGVFLYSSFFIVKWFIENNKNKNTSKEMIKIANIKEEVDKNDKYPSISIDFTNLIKENNKVKGWIQVPNTNINYPVLQHSDNDYYLIHNFYDKYSSAGWVFLDFRNKDIYDTNTIIYAHNRLDGSMFGTLKDTLNQEWHKNNKYIYYNTIDTINTYEVFSVYTINVNDFDGIINFQTDEAYDEYLKTIKKRSIIELNVDVKSDDKIITLYTCNKYNGDRTILHAKLVQTKSNS